MWFDARARLAEIEAAPTATLATPATRGAETLPRVAIVADVATPPRPKQQPAAPARAHELDPDAAALLEHIKAHGPTTYGAAALRLRWGVTRAWRAQAELRARGLVRYLESTGAMALEGDARSDDGA